MILAFQGTVTTGAWSSTPQEVWTVAIDGGRVRAYGGTLEGAANPEKIACNGSPGTVYTREVRLADSSNGAADARRLRIRTRDGQTTRDINGLWHAVTPLDLGVYRRDPPEIAARLPTTPYWNTLYGPEDGPKFEACGCGDVKIPSFYTTGFLHLCLLNWILYVLYMVGPFFMYGVSFFSALCIGSPDPLDIEIGPDVAVMAASVWIDGNLTVSGNYTRQGKERSGQEGNTENT